jgi:hypothetical protein
MMTFDHAGLASRTMVRLLLGAAIAFSLAACGTRAPFGSEPRVAPPQPLPQVQAQPSAGRPSVLINAAPSRVQDTIIARAQRRGTTIVGANQTGVTLEAPLASSTEVVEQQCGPHRPGRAQRIYLETVASGAGTVVSEDRFIVDDGSSVCQLALTAADVENGNRALVELKQQSEGARTASARPGTPGARPADPAGGLEPVNPGRPVVPIR